MKILNYNVKPRHSDVLILGGGIAGLNTALHIKSKKTILLCKGKVFLGNSYYAQGGIAVPWSDDDSPLFHLQDTLKVGEGLVDKKCAKFVVNSAKEAIKALIKLGVKFDKDNNNKIVLGREGAHSKYRIVHSKGDGTGQQVMKTLYENSKKKKNLEILENTTAVKILTSGKKVIGAVAFHNNKLKIFISPIIVLATGGIGQIYEITTNPEIATGEGIILAYNIGAKLADLEFMQFHPTAIYENKTKRFLISEAVRGEGAKLVNDKNEYFMEKYHPLKDLAPRDIVSQIIFKEIQKSKKPYVYLDFKTAFSNSTTLKKRFPSIYKYTKEKGFKLPQQLLPVAPAAHYFMGGIKVNLQGETNIKNLYAVGECSCTGLHGANRLASNSILEAIIFSKIVAENINFQKLAVSSEKLELFTDLQFTANKQSKLNVKTIQNEIKKTMWDNMGIIRNKNKLNSALKKLFSLEKNFNNNFLNKEAIMVYYILQLSLLITRSAQVREESRGAHFREDYPKKNDLKWKKHIIWQKINEQHKFKILK